MHKKGLIELHSIVLKGSYLVTYEKARDEEMGRFQAATISSNPSEQLDRYTKTIAISHPSDAFLGRELHEKLDEERSVEIDGEALAKIYAKNPSVRNHVIFRIRIDATKLTQWLDEYIQEFVGNALDSGIVEAFSYEKMRADVVKFLQSKLTEGISPANIPFDSTDIWGRDKNALFRAHLYETLLALEKEGAISILKFEDDDITRHTHVVMTTDDIVNYPKRARVRVLNLSVQPLNQRISINSDGSVLYLGSSMLLTKTPSEILKIMNRKKIGESTSWDELFVEIENWKEAKIPEPKKNQGKIYSAVEHVNEQFRKKFGVDFDLLEWKDRSVTRLR